MRLIRRGQVLGQVLAVIVLLILVVMGSSRICSRGDQRDVRKKGPVRAPNCRGRAAGPASTSVYALEDLASRSMRFELPEPCGDSLPTLLGARLMSFVTLQLVQIGQQTPIDVGQPCIRVEFSLTNLSFRICRHKTH